MLSAVELVTADLDAEPCDARILSPDEIARANCFRFERDRRRFVAGRSVLRRELGRRIDRTPSELTFRYGPYGKPSLTDTDIVFNVSHSGRAALYAFAPSGELGVDVELLAHTRDDDDDVAAQFFSSGEVATLAEQPSAERPAAFLRCWTRKEAFIKARGEGLSLPLQDFDVDFTPGRPPALLQTAWSADEPREWTLVDLSDLFDDAIAALAIRAANPVLKQRKEQQ
jgi:4'-phosphopantetheinyl transferase